MNNIQDTSLIAFKQVSKSLSRRQQQVYDILLEIEPANNLMISKKLDILINAITPRINELRNLGIIFFAFLKKCPYTDRLSMFWRIPRSENERQEQIKLILEDTNPTISNGNGGYD